MTLLIDVLILALLAGTLGYAFLVERRVRTLMAALRELQPLVGEFSAAVDKSQNSVGALRSAAEALQAAEAETPPPAAPHRATSEPTLRAPAAQSPRPEQVAPTHAPRQAAPGEDMSFRSVRAAPEQHGGVTRVTGKSDLVRSFFEAARSREA